MAEKSRTLSTRISWSSFAKFEERMNSHFFGRGIVARRRFVFRGMADSRWRLETTLDRYSGKLDLKDRTAIQGRLRSEFVREGLGYHSELRKLHDDEQDLLGRHHGLPSRYMDWTESPFIAAYFAFTDSRHDRPDPPTHVSIYRLNLGNLDVASRLSIKRETDLSWHNARAHEQQSVFIAGDDPSVSFDAVVGSGLTKYEIPASERWSVLSRLDSMGVTSAQLFRSLDGAAQTAALRIRPEMRGESHV